MLVEHAKGPEQMQHAGHPLFLADGCDVKAGPLNRTVQNVVRFEPNEMVLRFFIKGYNPTLPCACTPYTNRHNSYMFPVRG
jgi:hypothetical protein